MKLRKPCEHGRYEEHTQWVKVAYMDRLEITVCPGGEFLPEGALVIEKEPDWAELEMRMRSYTVIYEDATDAALDAKGWFLALAADQVGEPG